MCGILGWYNFQKKPSIEILRKLSQNIYLRGPDAYGEYESEYLSLVHRRLSIIDLKERSNQPFIDKQTGNLIIYNGEIYNFKEIKNEILSKYSDINFQTSGDTEVILLAYKLFGIDKLLEKLDGMFAFAIWDNKKKKLFLARDKLGEKPLFYACDKNNGIIFGSTFSSLSSHPEIQNRSKINFKSLNQYFKFNYLLFEDTFFENIKSLKPANYLEINQENKSLKIKQKQYWHLNNIIVEKQNYKLEEAKEKFIYLLKNSIKSRVISDVNVGTYLSGGIDSSLIAYLMREMFGEKHSLHHLSFDQKNFDESEYVQYFSKQLNLKPNIYKMPSPSIVANDFANIVEAMDQPMSDTAFLSNFYLSKYSSQISKVIVSGEGGDELFGGYITYTADIIKKKISLIPKQLLKKINNLFIKKIKDNYSNKIGTSYKIEKFFENSIYENNKAHILWRSIFGDEELKRLIKNEYDPEKYNLFEQILNEYKKVQNREPLNQHMYIDLLTFFTSDILYKTDRTTMHHSQEARLPLLDPKILEFAFSLPINLKINLFNKKILLKKILKDKLGKKLANRKKSGFNSPVGTWIAEDKNFKEMTMELLRSKHLVNFFDQKILESFFYDHIEKKKDNTYKIFNLMILSQWLKNRSVTL